MDQAAGHIVAGASRPNADCGSNAGVAAFPRFVRDQHEIECPSRITKSMPYRGGGNRSKGPIGTLRGLLVAASFDAACRSGRLDSVVVCGYAYMRLVPQPTQAFSQS